ncbi:hypothetical protein BJ138DRAFT_1087570 [Hygrophoropsis aurantiaca]|uniref:Uncharacterized protein n=1 Tax=Hygrophoropsis aurantiaca TaxID=72124 RepID=A0ACB8ACV2_9AGAM|nr:hypothetical protein BJ138DRAFT_1087570 [Hygrophoropsis aurantiaca]
MAPRLLEGISVGDREMCSKPRDDTFYFTTIVFLVEGVLFRVPRYAFVNGSEVFHKLFQLPVPEGGQADGYCDEHPICLEQIKQQDFKQLLKVLFPDCSRPHKGLKTLAEWVSVLKLAFMWDFQSVKQMAVHSISSMTIDPVDKFCLARDYDVQQWLAPALNDLAKRKEPIGIGDVEKIGLELALKVAAIRENLASPRGPNETLVIGTRNASNLDFTAVIQTMIVSSGLHSS